MPPVAVEERDAYGKPGITCSPVPGGAPFISPEDIAIKICRANYRLVCSGELQKRENQVLLERGVYLLITGNQKGKLAAR